MLRGWKSGRLNDTQYLSLDLIAVGYNPLDHLENDWTFQDLLEARSVYGLFLQHIAYELLNLWLYVRWELLWRHFHDRLHREELSLLAFERLPTGNKLIQENTGGPDVHFIGVRNPFQDLWGFIQEGSKVGLGFTTHTLSDNL